MPFNMAFARAGRYNWVFIKEILLKDLHLSALAAEVWVAYNMFMQVNPICCSPDSASLFYGVALLQLQWESEHLAHM